MGLTVRADAYAGTITGRYSMDGRCVDQIEVRWRFGVAVQRLEPGQEIPMDYEVVVRGNCPEAAREYFGFESRGYIFAQTPVGPLERNTVGSAQIDIRNGRCGNLPIDAANNGLRAWAGGRNRARAVRQTFQARSAVLGDGNTPRPCAHALLRFAVRDQRTGNVLPLVYHFER